MTRALLDAGHRAVGLCNVAINFQRDSARLLECRARARWSSTRSGSTTSPGCAGSGSTAPTCSPTCSPSTATSFAEQLGFPVRLLEELGAVPSYYLRYFYAHDAVLAEQLADGAVPRAQAVAEIERELLGLYRDPVARREAAAARAARRRLLQRGGDGARRVARRRRRSRPRRGRAERGNARGPGRGRRRRGARACRHGRAASRCRRRRSLPSCSASSSTWPPTSGSPSRRR